MATVIDSLVVELGLDPSKFTKGQREAMTAAKRTVEESRKGATEVEDSANRTGAAISKLKGQALGLLAVFLGGRGIASFTADVTRTDAQVGYLSKTLETSVKSLGAWRGAATQAGGSAAGATSTIANLVQEFNNFALTGQSSMIPYLRALGIAITTDDGKMRSMDDVLLDISEKFEKLGPARAAAFGAALGIDQGMLNLLLKGRDAVAAILKDQEKIGIATQAQTEQAKQLASAWDRAQQAATNMGRVLVDDVSPGLVKVLGFFEKAFATLATLKEKGETIGHAERLAAVERRRRGEKSGWMDSWEAFKRRYGKQVDDDPGLGTDAGMGAGPLHGRRNVEAYIREAARKRGVDPEQAVRVARSEGLNNYHGDRDSTGNPTSFGPFQLHYAGIGRHTAPGLGEEFTKKTGLDARDPKTQREQIDFALDYAKKNGWGPWHGWKGSPWAGIDRGSQLNQSVNGLPSGSVVPSVAGAPAAAGAQNIDNRNTNSSSTSEVHVGAVVIHTDKKTADEIAGTIKPAIERSSFANQAQAGPQ